MTKMKPINLLLFIILPLFTVSAFTWFMYAYHLASVKHQALVSAETVFGMTQAEISKQRAVLKRTMGPTSLQKNLPNDPDESGLIKEISSCAVHSGSQVQSLTFSGLKDTSSNRDNKVQVSTNSVNVQVIATGTTNQLLTFVERVQADQRQAFVRNCVLSVQQSQTQLTVDLSFPYVKQG